MSSFPAPGIRIGAFRCPVHHPDFRTAGPIEGYTVAFPRSAVWIRREDCPPFVADPGVVTIYNLGQQYERLPLSRDGDRCDWFSVSRDTALGIVAGIDPGAVRDPARPFPMAFAPSSTSLYYQQRRLFARIARGEVDPFEVEQEVIVLIGTVMERALGIRTDRPVRGPGDREMVERARAELARDPSGRPTVRELAARVGASPFHLCRVFRRSMGITLHHYLLELRTRLALERFGVRGISLSRLAHEMGFSSHSHFTAAFRVRLGFPPSRARAELSGRRATPQPS